MDASMRLRIMLDSPILDFYIQSYSYMHLHFV